MALVLIKLLFWALSSVASLVIFLIFRVVASAVVVIIHLIKAPAAAVGGGLEQAKSLFRSLMEYVLDALWDGIMSLVSSSFDLVNGTATSSVSLTTSALTELLDKTKAGLDDLATIFQEVFEGASEMVGKMAADLWDNFKDAVGYIMEHA